MLVDDEFAAFFKHFRRKRLQFFDENIKRRGRGIEFNAADRLATGEDKSNDCLLALRDIAIYEIGNDFMRLLIGCGNREFERLRRAMKARHVVIPHKRHAIEGAHRLIDAKAPQKADIIDTNLGFRYGEDFAVEITKGRAHNRTVHPRYSVAV